MDLHYWRYSGAELELSTVYSFTIGRVKKGGAGIDILSLDDETPETVSGPAPLAEDDPFSEPPQEMKPAPSKVPKPSVKPETTAKPSTKPETKPDSDTKPETTVKPSPDAPAESKPNAKSSKVRLAERITAKVHLFPEDRIGDLKEKIYLATSVPPYCQHLYYIDSDDVSHPLQYQIISESPIILDIRQDLRLAKVAGIPVHRNTSNELHVQARDHFYTLEQLLQADGYKHLNMLDMRDFMRSVPTIAGDSHQLNLVYYGFLSLYFPTLNWDAFQLLVRDSGQKAETSLTDTYPELQPSLSVLTKRYAAEEKLLDEVHSWSDSKANTGRQPSIKSSVLQSRYNRALVNIPALLNLLETSPEVPLIRARLYHNYKSVFVTKLHSATGEAAFEHLKYRMQMPEMSCIILGIRLTARGSSRTSGEKPKGKTGGKDTNLSKDGSQNSSEKHNFGMLVIRSHGPVQFRTNWAEDDHMSFARLAQFSDAVNAQITAINALGRSVFTSSYTLPEMLEHNTQYSSLTLHLFWGRSLDSDQFQTMKNTFQNDISSAVIAPLPAEEVVPIGTHSFHYMKGMAYDELLTTSDYNYSPDLDDYSYLTNAKSRVRWLAAYGHGRTCTIVTRTTDTRIEIQDVREQEFEQIRRYILFRLETLVFGKTKPKADQGPNTRNLLRLLKSRDPELYNFKQHGSDIVYSRICQRAHQPIPLSEQEAQEYAKSNRKAQAPTKYRNFTTGQPMYYVCPNPKFPHLSFITGQHPKNYCLPCCKKTLLEGTESTKKGLQHTNCLNTGHYEDSSNDPGNSRYIMNYGKPIEINRLGHLPEVFLRYLLYNSQTITDANLRDISKPAYYLYGVPQHSAVSDVGVLFAASNALGLSTTDYLKGLVSYLREHPTMFAGLIQGRMPEYFQDVKELSAALMELAGDRSASRAARFAMWNNVLIELMRYAYEVETLILEDTSVETSGTSHRSDSKEGMGLVLPRHVHHAGEIFPSSATQTGTTSTNSSNNSSASEKTRFLVLLRKPKRVRNLFSSNYTYFPIYLVVPQAFFRNGDVLQRLFRMQSGPASDAATPEPHTHEKKENNDLINLLYQLSQELLDKHRYKTEASLDDTAEMLLAIGYEMQELYVNRRGQVHTVSVRSKKDSSQSRASSQSYASSSIFLPVTQQYYNSEAYTIVEEQPNRKHAIALSGLLRFITLWNNKHTDQTLPLSSVLVLSTGQTKTPATETCIGIESRGLYLYCEAMRVDRLPKELVRTPRIYMLHTPEEINEQLASYAPAASLPDPQALRQKAEGQMRAYWQYLREVMHRIDGDRNLTLRKKVNVILGSDKKPKQKDDALRALGLEAGDIEKMRASGYRKISESAKSDTEIFGFDLIHLHQLRGLTDRNEIRSYLKKDLKLKESVELDLLAADFSNPLRRESLLQAIILEDVGLGTEVQHGPNEEVFILR